MGRLMEHSGMGGGMGHGDEMMHFHDAEIPEKYAGLTNPVIADETSVARGAEAFQTNCAACHGERGLGDGPAGKALKPAPASLIHAGQMLGDDYLFWRISEGGSPFGTAMPAWEAALDETTRWDLINYIRALSKGDAPSLQGVAAATRQAQVAAAGVNVMPFDLEATTHVFEKLEKGGLQQVTANDPKDSEQIALIRKHLAEEAERFQQGDFHDPEQIHGAAMPGLHELMTDAAKMTIVYSELPNGAQILYTTDEPTLVAALHAWFDAQVADHGDHAAEHW